MVKCFLRYSDFFVFVDRVLTERWLYSSGKEKEIIYMSWHSTYLIIAIYYNIYYAAKFPAR